jgi:hypothetical protein
LYGANPKIIGRRIEILHDTTAANLSLGVSPLLQFPNISLLTQNTGSPKHWSCDFGMLKRGDS